MNATVDNAGVETRREHHDVVVAVERRLHGIGETSPIAACLVDSHAHRAQSWEEHQQVVDQIPELAVVVALPIIEPRHTPS